MYRSSPMYEQLEIFPTWISYPAAFPASKPVLPQPFTEREKDLMALIQDCGMNNSEYFQKVSQLGLLLKTLPQSVSGKIRLRVAWRALAILFPGWKARLIITAYLISESDVSMLATPTARDWKSPGDQNHPRLNGSRGLPLPEEIGCNIHPEMVEALMGYPIGYTDLEH